MKEQEIRDWVLENGPKIQKEFGLTDWRISYRFTDLPTAAGECTAYYEYEYAKIKIDPMDGEFEDVEALERVLRHELLHVVHSPFDLMYQLGRKATPEGPQQEMWMVAYRSAMEMTVLNIEKMIRSVRNQQYSPLIEEKIKMSKTRKHPGFKAVQQKISQKEGIPMKNAGAILANASRNASPKARKANPRLNRVKGK